MAARLNINQKISVYANTSTKTHSEVETHDYEEIDISPVQIPDKKETIKTKPNEYLNWDDRKQNTPKSNNEESNEPVPRNATLQELQLPKRRHVTNKWKIATLIAIVVCFGLISGLVGVLVAWLSARVSPCSEGRCLNSGTCVVVSNEAVCTCVKGFNGTRCENSSCQNEGTCFIHQLQSRCACKNGFTGRVKLTLSPCSEGICLNSGTCNVVEDKAVCTCVKGFNGPRCEMTPCSYSSCQNDGTCFIHQLQSRCACKNGFTGRNCEISPCSEGRCLNSGTCNVVEDKAVCTCVKGFNGPRCEMTPCSTSSCKNEGTCFIYQLLPRCACRTGFIGANCEIKFPNQQDCSDLNSTEHKSGVYVIRPKGSEMFYVYCNMDIDGGGWTVFQRRYNGETDFFRGWNDYKEGFGDPKAEYWLGNSKLALMTSQKQYELRIDLEDLNGTRIYAKYSTFSISNESTNYKLTVGGYSGTAGDSLATHNNRSFSTKDIINNRCANRYKGAWWYNSCHDANLNGLFRGTESENTGMCWYKWKNNYQTMKTTSMMIRPKRT